MIQCSDKKFYIKPAWFGTIEHTWEKKDALGIKGPSTKTLRYLITEEQYQLVLVMEGNKNIPALTIVKKLIKAWKVKIGKSRFSNDLYFIGKENIPEMSKGHAFDLLPMGLLPVPTRFDLVTDAPDLDDVINCWEVQFLTHTVWGYFQKDGNGCNNKLAEFLLRQVMIRGRDYQKIVKAKLKKQFDMTGLGLSEAIQKFGERVIVKRK